MMDEVVQAVVLGGPAGAPGSHASQPWVQMPGAQVSFCRYRFSPTGELGYRGAVGLGYRSTASTPYFLL